jgi:epoxyqueuosine reductase
MDAAHVTPEQLRDFIVAAAGQRGFHRVAITPVTPPRRYQAYQSWLARDMHGGMGYMAADAHVTGRSDLRELLGSARSVVVVALAYAKHGGVPAGAGAIAGPGAVAAPGAVAGAGAIATPGAIAGPAEAGAPDEPDEPDVPIRGFVARYARGRDYHGVLKERLWSLAGAIGAFAGRDVAARPCVDSAPVLERDLAEAAGLGFTGKNTMLITPGLGSYTLLGELLLDVEVAPTPVVERDVKQRCGTCRACLDACPTQAFPAPFVLDARRCVSYLTIEHRGAIEPALRPGLGTMVFGCDVCQDACPFNARAPERHAPDPDLAPRAHDSGAPDLLRLLALGANQYRRHVEGTALRRASREQLVRNVCVALGNAGDARAVPALARLLADRSAVVRGHAAWALGQLGAADALAEALAHERDPAVQDELRAALTQARGRPA